MSVADLQRSAAYRVRWVRGSRSHMSPTQYEGVILRRDTVWFDPRLLGIPTSLTVAPIPVEVSKKSGAASMACISCCRGTPNGTLKV